MNLRPTLFMIWWKPICPIESGLLRGKKTGWEPLHRRKSRKSANLGHCIRIHIICMYASGKVMMNSESLVPCCNSKALSVFRKTRRLSSIFAHLKCILLLSSACWSKPLCCGKRPYTRNSSKRLSPSSWRIISPAATETKKKNKTVVITVCDKTFEVCLPVRRRRVCRAVHSNANAAWKMQTGQN